MDQESGGMKTGVLSVVSVTAGAVIPAGIPGIQAMG
jgi:hypothetical protein